MSIIVTNEITVPAERAEAVAAKFAENSRSLASVDGFEGFQLCRPTSPADDRWLVVTHWRDNAAYAAWRDSRGYAQSHPRGQHGAGSVVRHYQVEIDCPAAGSDGSNAGLEGTEE